MDPKQPLWTIISEAVTALEEEVATDTLKDLELSAAKLMSELLVSYNDFFLELQEAFLDKGLFGDEMGNPPIFGVIPNGKLTSPWKKLTPMWMSRKNSAFNSGDSAALDFYRGITTSLVSRGLKSRTQKSLYQYVDALASDKSSTMKFFGGMGLKFYLTRPDGKQYELTSAGQLKTYMFQGRDERGRLGARLDKVRLTAQITAFPLLEGLMVSQDKPDMLVDAFLGKQDPGNSKQWDKFMGQDSSHRAAIMPLIEWYLKVKFENKIKAHFF